MTQRLLIGMTALARSIGADYPLAAGAPITAQGAGTLPLMQAGGSGR
jgi:hypothetical protein